MHECGVATLSLPVFRARYPEFATLGDDVVTSIFSEAGFYCNNTRHSVIPVCHRAPLLYKVVAHILCLDFGINGHPPQHLVGMVKSATEGSVSVTVDYSSLSRNQQWWTQTKYGAAFWEMTKCYRGAFYMPPPCGPIVIVPRG